jgi:branched-chain amino acid transport system permease protein
VIARAHRHANSILFLAAVVLGGPGNMWGVMVGGFAVAYLPERFRFVQDKRYLFRPQGLLSRRQRSEEVHHPQDQVDLGGVGALGGADLADQPVAEGPYDA